MNHPLYLRLKFERLLIMIPKIKSIKKKVQRLMCLKKEQSNKFRYLSKQRVRR